MVLYPLCWFIFAIANLAVALYTLDKHGKARSRPRVWRASLYLPLALFTLLAWLGAVFEGQNPTMMLFEISPAAQKELVASLTNDVPEKFKQYTIAEIALLPVLAPENERLSLRAADLQTAEASTARRKILGWDETWRKQQDKLSSSRPFYLVTFAGIAWAVLAMLLCVFLVASMPREAPGRRRAVLATAGAILGIILWLPHRIYYNMVTKAVLFPPDRENIFNFWIPKVLSDHGITETEAIPLLFFLIASFVMVVVILKVDTDKVMKRVSQILKVFGLTGAVVWSSVHPKSFGAAVGLNGNWARFTLVSCLLLILFVVYFVYTVNQGDEAASVQRTDDDTEGPSV
jgi:hypothetical protein